MRRELKRILYIEDDSDIQTVTAMALEVVGGFSVTCCNSGQEALAAAPAANADLILLDVMMPGMDGLATLSALRGLSQTAATPVIFMTAKVQASEIQNYMRLGVTGVIAKPFDPMTVSAQIGEIWQKVFP